MSSFTVHASVQQFDSQPGQFRSQQLGEDRLHCSIIVFRLTFHARADDVRLSSFRKLLSDKVPHLRLFRHADDLCRHDFLTTRRQIANHRHVQITELSQTQTARNRCRCHHQHMRTNVVPGKAGALADAKSMLLVDHSQCQIVKFHAVLNDRLRTNHQLRFSGVDAVQQVTTFRCRQSTDQQSTLHAAFCQQFIERFPMLSGQNLRGCHQHRLESSRDRRQHRVDSDRRFACTDVCLEQPMHGS